MLNTSIRYLKGIGPEREKSFKELDIKTIDDLIYYFPGRYQDRTKLVPILRLEPGYFHLFRAKVLSKTEFKGFRRKHILKVLVSDNTASVLCVWFNQSYLSSYFQNGKEAFFYGRVTRYEGTLQITSPEFEFIEDNKIDYRNGIVPVYPLKEELSQRYFRNAVKEALDHNASKIAEFLPFDIRKRHGLINNVLALKNIHFPSNHKVLENAYRRFAFEEFFIFCIPFILRKMASKDKNGINHKIDDSITSKIINNFGFKLTTSQINVLDEIKNDMTSAFPMQRLLQGEVGSGKTIVSAITVGYAISGGYQAVLMCPTEILAYQHYNNFKKWFSWMEENIVFLSASAKNKNKIYDSIKNGNKKIIIGTHALLQEGLDFNNLGLIIIDEQHRFGLIQRNLLSSKSFYSLKRWPDVLIMTATPIPRTLALTIYGDLEISAIRELPSGRVLPETIAYSQDKVNDAYNFVLEELKIGRQAYIIYPIIEESLVLELKAATSMYEYLRKTVFSSYNVSIIHGQMKQNIQRDIMDKFRAGEIHVLVATSILEIGVDVPNATCMIVEHAERFGLTQLHQLRGRIARSQNKSFFLLIANPKSENSSLRISAIQESTDGFEIAQKDLSIRGPGEFFGVRQHGACELKIADPIKQFDLLTLARDEAKKLLESDPNLALRQNQALRQVLKDRIPNYQEFNKIT